MSDWTIRLGSQTDVGKVRDHQEDSLLWYTPEADLPALTRKGQLYVVADGMGGHAAGEVASKIAVDTIIELFKTDPRSDAPAVLRDAIAAANARILQAAGTSTDKGMGTTVVCAVICAQELFTAHVGDSRAYLFRNDHLWQLTQDHTVVGELLRQGQITPEQASQSSRRHVLSRALGSSTAVVADFQGPIQLQSGDLVLLCTDGISGQVPAEQIEATLSGPSQNPQRAADMLVGQANAAGGYDNATAIVLRIEEPVVEPLPLVATRPRKPLVVGLIAVLGLCLSCAVSAWLSGPVAGPFWLDRHASTRDGREAIILHDAANIWRGTPAPTLMPTQTPAIFVVVATATPTDTPQLTSTPTVTPTFTSTPALTVSSTPTVTHIATKASTPTPTLRFPPRSQ